MYKRQELDNLLIEKQIFPTADHVEIKREDFITQDEIDHNLGRGSGYSHGSFRIYDYFQEKHDSKEAAEFLKKEYGIGGGSHALAGADHSWQDHDFKGCLLYTSFATYQIWSNYFERKIEMIRLIGSYHTRRKCYDNI